jgi:hypothetical protein
VAPYKARSGARLEGLAGGGAVAWADHSFAITKIVRSRVIAGETPCAGLRVAKRAAEQESLAGITLHTATAVKLPGVAA